MHLVLRDTGDLSFRIHGCHHQCPGARTGYHQAKVRHARDASQLTDARHRAEIPGALMKGTQLVLIQVHLIDFWENIQREMIDTGFG